MRFTGKRIPRPYGTTQAMVSYHLNNDPEILSTIQNLIIQQWIINNGKIFGNHYSVQELSMFLKCNPEKIRKHMMEQLVNTKIWDKDHQQEIVESLMGQQITWALEDRMDISNQLNILRESQKGRYTPFVTTEVNKVLGLKLSTSNNFQAIIRALSNNNGSINIFNQQNNQTNIQSGISVEEAITIVQNENSKLLSESKEAKYIESHYPINELPEVIATKQVGINTDKEGVTLNRADINKAIDTYVKEIDIEDHHDTRRENELEIDPESDDPEVSYY
jgi:hypothetical protein